MKDTKRITYEHKLEKMKTGEITQTIREGNTIGASSHIFFIDIGLAVDVSLTISISCFEDCVLFRHCNYNNDGKFVLERQLKWTDPLIDQLAKDDGIDPPTGLELKRELLEIHKMDAFPRDGFEMQIIRFARCKV